MTTVLQFRLRSLRGVFARLFQEGFLYQSAYLAYLSLVCLVPVLAISVITLSGFHWFDAITSHWQGWMVQKFLLVQTTSLQPILLKILQKALDMSWWHVCIFFGITVLMMLNIAQVFRRVWSTAPRFSLSFGFFLYFLVLLLSPVLLALIFITGSLFKHWFEQWAVFAGYASFADLYFVASRFLLFIWFSLMNLVLPAGRVSWKSAMLAGVVTTVLLTAGRWLFSAFLNVFPTYQELYGALSVVPMFLIWLYISWAIIIFGALVGHEFSVKKRA